MSVIMVLAMVPSVAFAADANYKIRAYSTTATGISDYEELDVTFPDGKTKPDEEAIYNELKDKGLIDSDVAEEALVLKYFNGDDGNVKKMLKGRGTEYKFTKAKLRLGYIAMTYEVVEDEDVTATFDLNGGTVTDLETGNTFDEWIPTTVTKGERVWLPTAEQMKRTDGMVFDYWETDKGVVVDTGWYTLEEDTTFTAIWKVGGPITVTFDLNGGSVWTNDETGALTEYTTWPNKTATPGEVAIWVPEDSYMQYVDHTFLGWYIDGTDTKVDGGKQAFTEDTNLVARWEKDSYKVTIKPGVYNPTDATFTTIGADFEEYVEKGGKVPAAPEIEGYEFDKWYEDYHGGSLTEADIDSIVVNSELELYAGYKKTNYVATFDFDGGKWGNKDGKDPEDIVAGYQIDTPSGSNMKKEGYKFDGWDIYTSGGDLFATLPATSSGLLVNAHGEAVIDDDTRIEITSNLKFVAKWAEVHTVTFDANNGNELKTKEVKDGETVGKPLDPDKGHRNFIGWYVVDEQGNVADEAFDFGTPITEDITLKACYTIAVEYNIYVDTFEGSEITAKDVVEIPEGEDIEDYLNAIFDGTVTATEFDKVYKWYSRPVWVANYTADFDTRIAAFENGAPTVDFNDIDSVEYSNGTYRLFAMKVTDANAVTLTFENVLHGDKLEPMRITKDTPFGDVAVENVAEGYQLEGWYDGTTKVSADTTFDKDTTLKAKWNVLVTLNLFKNGDFTTPEVIDEWVTLKISTGEGKLATKAPTYGWYTKADWEQVAAGEDMTFDDIAGKEVSDVVTAPATYYGMQTEMLKAKFSAGVGVKAENMPADTLYASGSKLGELSVPTRDKYQFVCWTVNGEDIDLDTFTITEDTEFVAKWEARDIVINYKLVNANDLSKEVIAEIESQIIKYGETTVAPTVTINGEEYRVDGWYNDEECTDKVDFAKQTFTADETTLYGKVLTKVTLNVYTDLAIKPMVSEVFVPIGGEIDLQAIKATYENGGKAFYGWYNAETWANIQKVVDYTFDNTNPDDIIVAYSVTEPVEFYGKLSEGYKVTFNAGEGVKAENMPEPSTVIVNYGKKVAEPTKIPTRTGYTFDGWAYDFESPVYHDTIITAKWTLNTYIINYDPNGGVFVDGAKETRSIAYGAEYGELLTNSQVSRDGAKLIGWTTEKDNPDTLVKPRDKYLMESDSTLYALWEITGVTVTYVTNGGKVADLSDTLVVDSKGNEITHEKLPYGTAVNDVRKAVKDGLKFRGWYLDEDLTVPYDNSPIKESVTLYAKYYAEITFQIYENDNYAATIGAKTIEVDEYDKVELPTAEDLGVVLRDTDEFFGWYTVEEFGKVQAGQEAVTIEDVTATGEVTYCAKVLRHYIVTFNTNGGSEIAAQDVVYKGLATRPEEDPTRVGYVFAGWYEDEALTTEFDFTTPITADTTVYAKWNRAIVTITFNIVKDWMVGGGTNETVPINIYYGDVIPADAVPGAAYTEVVGYTFDGWYLNGELFDVATTPVTENITLDAAWHLNQFEAAITGEYVYNGQGIEPEITITDNATKEALDLEANPVDITYTAVSENAKLDDAGLPLNAGTYKVTVSQKYAYPAFSGYKYCKAEPVELEFEIKAADISDTDRFIVVLEDANGNQTDYNPEKLVEIDCTGSPVLLDGSEKEGYKVVVYDKVTKKILDYSIPEFVIEYADNLKPGTATATVNGAGNYTGSVQVKYTLLNKYYYVTGVVRFNSGRVIKYAKVTLTGTDYLGNEVVRTTKTDKHGKYTIKNLKKGNYIVTYRNESKVALLNEQN